MNPKTLKSACAAWSRRALGRGGVAACAVLALLGAAPAPASAQYPDRPIKMIVPYPAGGTTDIIARAIQQPLSDMLGQPVIIDNRPGAGGEIGTIAAARSKPDGYTLAFANSGPTSILPLLKRVPYDVQADLMPVSMVVDMPLLLGVAVDSPLKDLQQFIAEAKRQEIFYGSIGIGSVAHLAGAALNDAVGTRLQHVAFNGGAQMTTGFLGGQVQAIFVTAMDGAPLAAGNRVRYIAVASPARISNMPQLPTMAEAVSGFSVGQSTFGIMVPAGTPAPIVARLHDAVVRVLAMPAVRKFLEDRSVVVRPSTPQEYADHINKETQQFRQVIERNRIVLE